MTSAPTGEFKEWVFNQPEFHQKPGDLRWVVTDPTTGKTVDFAEYLNIAAEGACFEYCYGLTLFIVLVHFNRRNRNAAYGAVCNRYKSQFGHYISAGVALPGVIISPERKGELTATSAEETFVRAMGAAMLFWEPYYELNRELSKSEVFGPKLLAQYLEALTSPPWFPFALPDFRFAEKVGPKVGGNRWEHELETHFGEIRRRLIRRGKELLRARSRESRTPPTRQPRIVGYYYLV